MVGGSGRRGTAAAGRKGAVVHTEAAVARIEVEEGIGLEMEGRVAVAEGERRSWELGGRDCDLVEGKENGCPAERSLAAAGTAVDSEEGNRGLVGHADPHSNLCLTSCGFFDGLGVRRMEDG